MTTAGEPEIYREFASVYDAAGFSTFSEKMVPYALNLLDHLGWKPPARSVLDLACGTGTAALELARRGWRVTGVDRSPEMLAVARRKAAAAGQAIRWIQADMRAFQVPEPQGMVTCFFDALNYLLTPADLEQAFRRVHAALLPGGVFVFDMNTPHGLEAGWTLGESAEVYPNLVSYMHAVYQRESQILRVRLSFYVPDPPGYRRIEEVHLERGYPCDAIERLLEAAGFADVRLFRCFTFDPAAEPSSRVAAVARRG
ncbi:MAG TPA: class I SAM-dependent methyltransferase [Limnochorda sp.]